MYFYFFLLHEIRCLFHCIVGDGMQRNHKTEFRVLIPIKLSAFDMKGHTIKLLTLCLNVEFFVLFHHNCRYEYKT